MKANAKITLQWFKLYLLLGFGQLLASHLIKEVFYNLYKVIYENHHITFPGMLSFIFYINATDRWLFVGWYFRHNLLSIISEMNSIQKWGNEVELVGNVGVKEYDHLADNYALFPFRFSQVRNLTNWVNITDWLHEVTNGW